MTGGGFGGQADVLYIDVETRMDKFESKMREVEQQAEQSSERVGSKLSSAFSLGAKVAAGAAAGLGLALAGAVPAMQELALEADKTRASHEMFLKTLERTGTDTGKASGAVAELSEKLKVAPSVIEEGMTLILRAGGSLESATQGLLAAGASAAASGADIGKAVENAAVGLAMGRSEMMEYAGIVVNASDAHKEYAKTLGVKTEALTEAQKIEAYSKAVYKESAMEVADLGVVMGGLAGQQADAAKRSAELRQVIGEAVLPIVRALGGTMGEVQGQIMAWVKSLDKEQIAAFAGQIKQMADVIRGGVSAAFNVAGPIIQTFAKYVVDVANVAVPLLRTAIQSVATQAAPVLVAAFNGAKVAVAAVSEGFQKFNAFAQRNREILIPLAAGIGTVAGALAIHKAATIAATAVTTAWTAATTLATTASVALRAALTFITGPVGLAVAAITALVAAGVYLYRNWDTVKAKALEIWGNLRQIVVGAMNSVTAYLRGIDLREIGLDIVRGLANGILAGPRLVLEAARGLGTAVMNGVKSVLKIQSPSRVMMEVGQDAGTGLVIGLTRTAPDVQKAAALLGSKVYQGVVDELAAGMAEIQKAADQPVIVRGIFGDGAAGLAEALSRYGVKSFEELAEKAPQAARLIEAAYRDVIQATRDAAQASQDMAQGIRDSEDALADILANPVGERTSRSTPLDDLATRQRRYAAELLADLENLGPEAVATAEDFAHLESTYRGAAEAGAITTEGLGTLLAKLKEFQSFNDQVLGEYARASQENIDRIKAAAAEEVPVPDFEGMARELALQGREYTDLIALAQDYAKEQNEAGVAAQKWLDSLKPVAGIVRELKKDLPEVASAARRVDLGNPTPLGPVEAVRGPRTQAPSTETAGRGSLAPDAAAWKAQAEAQEYAREQTEKYRDSLKGLTLAQLETAKASALAAGQQARHDAIVLEITRVTKEQADTQAEATKNTQTLTDARQKLTDTLKGGAAPYAAEIASLEALRGKPGVVAAELDELIAAYQRLQSEVEKRQALEQKINLWADYAQKLIPVVTGAMEALAGTSSEVAAQWGQDLGSMVSDLTNFGLAIARGDYLGAVIQALTSIVNWWGRNKKAAEEAAKATREYNEQFRFSQNGYGTREVSSYQTGFLFWSTTHYVEQIDTLKRDIALAIEGGFVNGIQDGFSQALAANDFSLFEKSLKSSVGKAVLDGLIESFINQAVLARIIGPAIDNYLQTGDTAALRVAIQSASGEAEAFYNNVLAPIAQEFGMLGTGAQAPAGSIAALQAEISALQADLNLATSGAERATLRTKIADLEAKLDGMTGRLGSGGGAAPALDSVRVEVSSPVIGTLNLDLLGTLSSVIERAAPRIEAGGQAIVQGAGLIVAAADRMDRILTRAETDWGGLRGGGT